MSSNQQETVINKQLIMKPQTTNNKQWTMNQKQTTKTITHDKQQTIINKQ